MNSFEAIMLVVLVPVGLGILWKLAVDGLDRHRRRYRTAYEVSLDEIADIAVARDADRRSQERAYEKAARL